MARTPGQNLTVRHPACPDDLDHPQGRVFAECIAEGLRGDGSPMPWRSATLIAAGPWMRRPVRQGFRWTSRWSESRTGGYCNCPSSTSPCSLASWGGRAQLTRRKWVASCRRCIVCWNRLGAASSAGALVITPGRAGHQRRRSDRRRTEPADLLLKRYSFW